MAIKKDKEELVRCKQCGEEFILEKVIYAQKIDMRDTLTYVCPYCNEEHRVKTSGDWEIAGVRKIR